MGCNSSKAADTAAEQPGDAAPHGSAGGFPPNGLTVETGATTPINSNKPAIGSNPNATASGSGDDTGIVTPENPLIAAARTNNLTLVKELFDIDTSWNILDKDKFNVLLVAVRHEALDVVHFIVQADVTAVHKTKYNGDTGLHVAARGTSDTALDIIRVLLEAGASKSAKNMFGKIPRDYATHEDARSLLFDEYNMPEVHYA